MKGQISMAEAVFASIILFVSFNVLINTEIAQNKWSEAVQSLSGNDALITSDRLGKLYNYSFSTTIFNSEFISKTSLSKDYIVKVETQGSKNVTYIACNCTQAQIDYLRNISNVKVNNRNLAIDYCSTNLEIINPCTGQQQYPDVLIIWGYRDMTANLATLTNLVSRGVGIIEVADIRVNQVDDAQQRIFGLKWNNQSNFPNNPNEFLKPAAASAPTYQTYKWFHHVPYTLKSVLANNIPTEGGIQPCASNDKTSDDFKFNNTVYTFWICGTTSLYFDTDGNLIADKLVTQGQNFTINSSNFKLNYIDNNSTARLSFKPNYKFRDFVSPNNAHNKLSPFDDNKNKVLLSAGFWDQSQQTPVSVMIFNGTETKAVWIADFSRDGLSSTGDDHKQLILSTILSIAKKKSEDTSTRGLITTYLNTINNDMFEVYRIDLKIIKPF